MCDLTEASISAVTEKYRNIWAPHPFADRALSAFARTHRDRKGGNSAQAMMLVGPPGTGKSACAHSWISGIGAGPSAARLSDAALTIRLSGGSATPKSLGVDILNGLHEPGAERFTRYTAPNRINLLLERASIEVVILDEVQLIVTSESTEVRRRSLEFLKTILNDSPCAWILIGQLEARVMLENASFRRRTEEYCEMHPYDWAVPGDRDGWRAWLRTMDDPAFTPFATRAGLDELEFANAIHFASGGLIGEAASLIAKAAAEALSMNADRLQREHFALALDHRIGCRPDLKANPFSGGTISRAPSDDVKIRHRGGRRQPLSEILKR
jgi:hypothetical protein